MTAKRNTIANEIIEQLRAATTIILSGLDDESEITRGPAHPEILTELDIPLKYHRVFVEVGEDDVEPGTVARETHEMTVGILAAMRSHKREDAIHDVIEMADEIERAIYADRTLDGNVEDIHISRFTPGYLAGETDFISFVSMEAICRFQTTD